MSKGKKNSRKCPMVEGPESPYWKVTPNARPREGNQDSHQGTSQGNFRKQGKNKGSLKISREVTIEARTHVIIIEDGKSE